MGEIDIRKVDDALAYLEELKGAGSSQLAFDLVFVDADKQRLKDYVVSILDGDLLAEGGVMVVDNVLWKGLAGDNNSDSDAGAGDFEVEIVETKKSRRQRKLARIMHEFNEWAHQDERLDVVLLPLRDGLSIIRRRSI